jgi:transcriptional regulator with XRE-family HTH domain
MQSGSQISRWEKGTVVPPLNRIAELCKIFEKELSYFWEPIEIDLTERCAALVEPIKINMIRFSEYEELHNYLPVDLEKARDTYRMTRLCKVRYAQPDVPATREIMKRKIFAGHFSAQRIEILYDLPSVKAALYRAEIYRTKPANYQLRLLPTPHNRIAFPTLNMVAFDKEIFYLGAYHLTANARKTSIRFERQGL